MELQIIDISTIEVPERQRKLDAENVRKLERSITTKGLLHPIVVVRRDERFSLVAGMHRLEAVKNLHKYDTKFYFNAEPVPRGAIPATLLCDLSRADIMEAELEENIVRVAVPWQDVARAISTIHNLRKEENPSQTFTDTARELKELGASAEIRTLRGSVHRAVVLAQNLHRPTVARAKNPTEAFTILLREEEARLQAEVISRRKSHEESDYRVILGDLCEVLPTLDDNTFDVIIADPPYGIGADAYRKKFTQQHEYEDAPEAARKIIQEILSNGFRICKPQANLFIFGDVDNFPFFKTAASAMGWTPFRTPIVWRKSESEGITPWGREGFRRTYDLIFYATKGRKGLFQSPIDVLTFSRAPRGTARYHAAQKPVELIRFLIECSSMPGDHILDPCCGAGTTLRAARESGRRALGIEINQTFYNYAVLAAKGENIEE